MNTITLLWVGAGIVFLIIEITTAVFYGLALAIAAFLVALYTFFFPSEVFDVVPALLFVILSILTSYFLPKWLTPKSEEKPQGMDLYIGETRRLKAVGEDWKISLDGVDYIVIVDEAAEEGDRVEIFDRKGSVFYARVV